MCQSENVHACDCIHSIFQRFNNEENSTVDDMQRLIDPHQDGNGQGPGGKIRPLCHGHGMEDVPFESDAFALIWSEGAICNIGFEKGVRDEMSCSAMGRRWPLLHHHSDPLRQVDNMGLFGAARDRVAERTSGCQAELSSAYSQGRDWLVGFAACRRRVC